MSGGKFPRQNVHRGKSNPEHLKILKSGSEAWNKWRDENPQVQPDLRGLNLHKNNLGHDELRLCNLAGACLPGVLLERQDLSGARLSGVCLADAVLTGTILDGADLQDADLRGARFESASLEGAKLQRAKMDVSILPNIPVAYPCDLDHARLYDADLEGADLSHAVLKNARLAGVNARKVNFFDADLTEADLFNADFEDANFDCAKLRDADLVGARLTGARLTQASLEGADLRETIGLRLDSTIVRNARFSAKSRDPWSILRRGYTGPRLLFHLLLLVAFLLPYVAKTVGWVGVNRVQRQLEALVADLRSDSEASGEEVQIPADTREWLVDKLDRQLPGKNPEAWRESRVWRLVIGVDRGLWYWLTAVSLILYNVCRALLTWFVSAMRDEEERSGVSPCYRREAGRRPLQARSRPDVARWRDFGFEAYAWLMWPHRAVRVILWIAVGSFLFHAVHWLSLPVWIPAT